MTSNETTNAKGLTMVAFATRNELESAWVRETAHQMHEQSGYRLDNAKSLAAIMVRGKAVYVPHVYRGGFVIRGFGYSTERIGKYIGADRSGDPLQV